MRKDLMTTTQDKVWRAGGCHCGAIRFEARLAETIHAYRCNCSICTMTGFLHVFAEREDFQLVQGGESLIDYRFNTGVACHRFCRVCGVKSFYIPRSHPDAFSINFHCLDDAPQLQIKTEDFDGQNWEQSIAALRTKDAEPG